MWIGEAMGQTAELKQLPVKLVTAQAHAAAAAAASVAVHAGIDLQLCSGVPQLQLPLECTGLVLGDLAGCQTAKHHCQ